MIENIIDHRQQKYSVTPIDAVIEPSAHDNGIPGATQFPQEDPSITTYYEDRRKLSVKEAIEWANGFQFPVTLFLYDHPMDSIEVYSVAELERVLGGS